KIFLVTIFALSRDGRVEAAKWAHGFHRIIGTEGEFDSMIQELRPGIRMRGSLLAQARLGPVHVGEQMTRLHGGDHLQLPELQNLSGTRDLGMLDAQTIVLSAIGSLDSPLSSVLLGVGKCV